MDRLKDIPDYLQRSVTLLSEFSWIFRESNTRFVEKGTLENLPNSWIEAIAELSNDEFNKLPRGLINKELPEDLRKLLVTIQGLGLDIKRSIRTVTEHDKGRLKGMSPKKAHEITHLADVILDQCKNVDVLVDLGCGLGYLSQYLHERHPFKILALECDDQRVESALKRQRRFFPSSVDHVKFLPHFVTTSSMDFIKEQISSEFNLREPRIALIGLHACGDLTVTALKLSVVGSLVEGLVVMPCCYHRMTLSNETEFQNFPLSAGLRRLMTDLAHQTRSPSVSQEADKHRRLTSPTFHRPFLRLACQQSITHWQKMSEEEHRIHGNRMYTRSLVGAIAAVDNTREYDAPCDELIIRRISKFKYSPSITFDGLSREYALFAKDEPVPWTDDHLQRYKDYFEKYPNGGFLAEVLTGLQTAIQQICEFVVLLDKVQYINELGVPGLSCHIEKITTDELLSPRCYALIVEKKDTELP